MACNCIGGNPCPCQRGGMVMGSVSYPAPYRPLPATMPKDEPLPQDIIRTIAEDIGKDTAAYIEVMYPEAVKAASSTFRLSLRNHVYNEIMAAVKLNDVAEIRKRLAERAEFRKKWVAQYRKMRRAKPARRSSTGCAK